MFSFSFLVNEGGGMCLAEVPTSLPAPTTLMVPPIFLVANQGMNVVATWVWWLRLH